MLCPHAPARVRVCVSVRCGGVEGKGGGGVTVQKDWPSIAMRMYALWLIVCMSFSTHLPVQQCRQRQLRLHSACMHASASSVPHQDVMCRCGRVVGGCGCRCRARCDALETAVDARHHELHRAVVLEPTVQNGRTASAAHRRRTGRCTDRWRTALADTSRS